MRDLNFDLKRLQAAHDDGSHGTRTARSYALAQIADTLHELGFRGLRATGLRRKHVVALVREWKRQGRSIGTMNPSSSVLKFLFHQYVEGISHHPVTTSVRTRRRCARVKGSAGIRESRAGELAKLACFESQWSVGERSPALASAAAPASSSSAHVVLLL